MTDSITGRRPKRIVIYRRQNLLSKAQTAAAPMIRTDIRFFLALQSTHHREAAGFHKVPKTDIIPMIITASGCPEGQPGTRVISFIEAFGSPQTILEGPDHLIPAA